MHDVVVAPSEPRCAKSKIKPSPSCPPSAPSAKIVSQPDGERTEYHCLEVAYQGLHGAVKRMPVVPAELGVGSLERRVPRGLRLLNTAVGKLLSVSRSLARFSDSARSMIFHVPVPVCLLGLVVLGRVLGLCRECKRLFSYGETSIVRISLTGHFDGRFGLRSRRSKCR